MASQSHYDVILMDMHMPVMDGFTATRTLRQRGNHATVIALTADVMKDDESKCKDAGCDRFLTKPIEMERLLSELQQVLDPSGASPHSENDLSECKESLVDEHEEQICEGITHEKSVLEQMQELSDVLSDEVLVNEQPIYSTLPMDDPDFHAIVESFVERLQMRVKQMRELLTNGDYAALVQEAHWLKGAAGTVGLGDFTEPAAALQNSAKVEDANTADHKLAIIESLVQRIRMPA